MNRAIKLSIMVLAAIALLDLAGLDAAFARGGAPNIMDSPGYQRALQESRQRLQRQPEAAPTVAGPRAHRHAHRRHRH
jgi:hypothetical protein